MRTSQMNLWGIVVLSVALAGCGAAGPPDAAMAPREDESFSMAAPPPQSDDVAEVMPTPDAMDDPDWSIDPPELATTAADDGPPDFAATAVPEVNSFAPRSEPSTFTHHGGDTIGKLGSPAHSTPRHTPQPPTGISHVDEIVSRLAYGTVGFYTPNELPFGETFVQEVVLSPTESEAVLRSAMSNPTAPAEFVSLQVAPRMEATLTGRGFEIEPLSEPLQVITSHRPTKWRFNVTPIAHGRQELHLSLLAHIDVDGRDAPLTVETKDAVIEVDITVAQRFAGVVSKNWQWLWAAVIVPAIGFVWRKKTGRERRPVAQSWNSGEESVATSRTKRIDSDREPHSSSTRPRRSQVARKASRAGTPGSSD